MKKFLKKTLVLSFMVLTLFSFCACDGQPLETPPETPQAPFTVSPPRGNPNFITAGDITLTYNGNYHYVASGTPGKMIESQAYTWGVPTNTLYTVLVCDVKTGSKCVYGWRAKEDMNKPFESAEIDNNLIKSSTASIDLEYCMLYLSYGETINHPDKPIWRIEVTPKNSQTKTVYTVDFSKILHQ